MVTSLNKHIIERKYKHALKYGHVIFSYNGEYYDTFFPNEPKVIDKKYIDDLYELIGHFTFNPYYDVYGTGNELKELYFHEPCEKNVKYSWGDFALTIYFIQLVNIERNTTSAFSNINTSCLKFKEILSDLVNKYIKETR